MMSTNLRVLIKDRHKDLEQWFMDSVGSDNGLTFDEFKAKIREIAFTHKYYPSYDDWRKLKEIFGEVDTDNNDVITPSDFEKWVAHEY